ncbi:hypothetical protein [Spiroplasma sp. AdecLV25b]|uniref:hypothetical protein n=1 Tax=Spiroplasma sp. AdecLV25b TaxID=3027162 RepID=UPI0027DF07BE|nr:hypothetical protein [Spiroplasma sp. AdecLV25b]
MLNFKNLLMITTVSLLASSGIINHHKLSNNLQQINSETIICNNSYQSLNNSTILSNKDSSDNYHIYDINNIKTNDNLVPYISQLTVNNEGELVFDKEKIPDAITEDWNNAVSQDREEEQIVSADEGTKILQKQNLSKIVTSVYTFSSTDLHWTLLQFGGANTHIQLTGEGDVSLIPNSQDLSESLGLYNISQSHPGNSKILCSRFAKNFIS